MADGPENLPGAGATAAAPPLPGALEPFRHRAFREVWLGNTASQLGSQVQSVGAAWLMTELTSSHALVAAVAAAVPTSMLLFPLVAGGLADNFDRRRIMLTGQWLMLVVSAILAALTYAGMLGAWGLLGFTLAVGSGMALMMPSWHASIRVLMPERRILSRAIALNTISFNLARSVGPALGGLVLAVSGVAAAFAINALSYIALILALKRWNPDLPPPRREPLLQSVKAGIAFCRNSRPVRRVVTRGPAYSFAALAVLAMLPVILRGRLAGNESQFGVLLGAFGVGSIIGAFGGPDLRRRLGSNRVVAVGATFTASALVAMALAPTVAALLPFIFLGGAGWTMSMNVFNVAIQVRAPPELIGRCISIYQTVTMAGATLGAWTWGLLADAVNAQTSVLVAASWLAVSTLVLSFACPLPAPGEGVVPDRS